MSSTAAAADPTNALEAVRVGKRYRNPAGEDVVALDDVSLRIGRGDWVALAGPSGAGKTTLLAILGGVQRPTAGDALVLGSSIVHSADAALARLRRRIGFVFQQLALLPRMSVWENVTYGLVPLGMSRRARREHARGLLAALDLEDCLRRRPEQLSGGQQQRVALARALAGEPELILLDEPTAHLDTAGSEALVGLLAARRSAGATIVVATHDQQLMARAGRVVHLQRGRIVEPEDTTTR
jgi:putative ABC transport system ATP-binding protein